MLGNLFGIFIIILLTDKTLAVCPGANEIYYGNNHCEKSCSTLYDENSCLPPPSNGCFCQKGFVRDSFGNCIKVEDCYLELCGENEFRNCGSACDTTCATLNIPCPIINIVCNNMCYCNPGYARDSCGLCIPITDCPVTNGCKSNTSSIVPQPDQCPITCDTCNQIRPPCNQVCTGPGCQCNSGYIFETTSGICVKPEDCFKCDEPNEVWSDTYVDCTCDNVVSGTISCEEPTPGCRCIDGYVRNADGVCVAAGTCPRCPLMEEYRECGTPCPASCSNQQLTCSPPCIQGCFCKDGLVRDSYGKCIPPSECPSSAPFCAGDPNAVKTTFSPSCRLTCDNYMFATELICDNTTTETGCSCKSGYVLNTITNRCVTPGQCPPGCGGDSNAVFLPCGNVCPVTCDNVGQDNPCILICLLGGGCGCKDGYVQVEGTGITGPPECILPDQCQCPPMEEFRQCGSACPASCSNYYTDQMMCNSICVQGCFCKEGLVRDFDGNCILPTECPTSCGGDPNAVKMMFSPTCRLTCDNYYLSAFDLFCDMTDNEAGCTCKYGYVLDTITNRCVTPDQCPPGCGGNPNAIFLPCGNTCPVTCDNIGQNRVCPLFCILGGGCACKDGYVQVAGTGITGPPECILPDQCPRCGKNAEFICSTACQRTCTNLDVENCEILTIGCVNDCYCNEGFARNSYGICIPENICTNATGCRGDINAVMNSCPAPCSVTCNSYKGSTKPVRCKVPCPPGGRCLCDSGKIIDETTGTCVGINDCYKCTQPNEAYTTGYDLSCSDINSPNFRQILRKKKPELGCHCKADFIRNDAGLCIPTSVCPQCSSLEEYKECGSACPKSCINPNDQICTDQCVTGCFCKEPLVRSEQGLCIPLSSCPAAVGCGGDPNASKRPYIASCVPTCEDPTAYFHCKKIPQPLTIGCVCNSEYVLNTNTGLCITYNECIATVPDIIGCGGDINASNGTYLAECVPTCQKPFLVNCPKKAQPVSIGCICNIGYIYDSSVSRCVLLNDCTSTGFPVVEIKGCDGDPHASNKTFIAECEPTCVNPNILSYCHLMPTKTKKTGCLCDEGYLLDTDYSRCVLEKQCPRTDTPTDDSKGCGNDINASYGTYIPDCTPTCEKPFLAKCPYNSKKLTKGCICNTGYIYDTWMSKCVLMKDCKTSINKPTDDSEGCGNDINASYGSYIPDCTPTCEKPFISKCPHKGKPLTKGCICNTGYIFDTLVSKCVLMKDCKNRPYKDINRISSTQGCGGDENASNGTFVAECEPTCDDPNALIYCHLMPYHTNKTGCLCNKGYLLDLDTLYCVPEADCPNDTDDDSDGCEDDINATYGSYIADCIPTCDTPSIGKCPNTSKSVVNGCVCNTGYIYDKIAAKCVLLKDCTVKPINRVEPPLGCGGDKHATNTTFFAECEPTCLDPNALAFCGLLSTHTNKTGCLCNKGYLRDTVSLYCVPEEECPSVLGYSDGCAGDRNASYGTYTADCIATCEKPSTNCPKTVQEVLTGCVCNSGYIFDTIASICVMPNDCPKKSEPEIAPTKGCGGDENASNVTFVAECLASCDNPNVWNTCRVSSSTYTVGCQCNTGFLLNTVTKRCVLEKECPLGCGGDINASFYECGDICALTCDNWKNPPECSEECIAGGGCGCSIGFLRNANGLCVKHFECDGENTTEEEP